MADIARKLNVLAVDVGEGSTSEWEIQGYKVEESAMELNPDSESITDVTGTSYTTLNKLEKKQTFDPNRLRTGAKLAEKLLESVRTEALESFSGQKVLVVYGWIGTDGAYEADVYDDCTIIPQSIGGSSYVDMPIEISFGGNITKGTVDKLTAGMVFTPTATV